MDQPGIQFGWLKKRYAKAIIYADRREWFRKTFKRSYIRLLKGSHVSVLDDVCRRLAAKITKADRSALHTLKHDGHRMLVLSCGTADLSERILEFAGLRDCFECIEGNRFLVDKSRIKGMDLRLPNPQDKLNVMRTQNLSPERTIVVGDGYTDLPLMNWSAIPVMIDRTGRKRKRFTSHNFYFISSIPEILKITEDTETHLKRADEWEIKS
jgi:phosphoserine phosphatase